MQLNYLPDFKYTMEKEKLRVFFIQKIHNFRFMKMRIDLNALKFE